ncbi:MAG: hypothetical protein GPI94_21430, partial [Microcystis aeruginosa LG13-03]|nr:hypothetical protein [Microcystis aeruginosa LG13-13]NCR06307.1 hypothetical protein [Microcystis aeruginosa LG13-03]NCR64554.1 hypothetical protein [Microcystis aeruginosa LG11-05]
MNNNISQRQKFRTETYSLLGRAKAATFGLMDAVLAVRNASCLADFSLSPLSRGRWSSIYESLQDCRPSRNQLMRLDLEQIPMNESEYIMMA